MIKSNNYISLYLHTLHDFRWTWQGASWGPSMAILFAELPVGPKLRPQLLIDFQLELFSGALGFSNRHPPSRSRPWRIASGEGRAKKSMASKASRASKVSRTSKASRVSTASALSKASKASYGRSRLNPTIEPRNASEIHGDSISFGFFQYLLIFLLWGITRYWIE